MYDNDMCQKDEYNDDGDEGDNDDGDEGVVMVRNASIRVAAAWRNYEYT